MPIIQPNPTHFNVAPVTIRPDAPTLAVQPRLQPGQGAMPAGDLSAFLPSAAPNASEEVGVQISRMIMNGADATSVLAMVEHMMSEGFMGELRSLAEKQKSIYDKLETLRDLRKSLDAANANGTLMWTDQVALEAKFRDAGLDGSAFFSALTATYSDEAGRPTDRIYLQGQDPVFALRTENIEGLERLISDQMDNLKGQSSQLELEMQRVTSEESRARQLSSNLLKKYNDTAMAIVRNMA